jgi:hypothetical protein
MPTSARTLATNLPSRPLATRSVLAVVPKRPAVHSALAAARSSKAPSRLRLDAHPSVSMFVNVPRLMYYQNVIHCVNLNLINYSSCSLSNVSCIVAFLLYDLLDIDSFQINNYLMFACSHLEFINIGDFYLIRQLS